MIPTVAPNIAKAATNGMIISSPSMRTLLSIISAAPGPAVFNRRSGTAGLPAFYAGMMSTVSIENNTIINYCAYILLKFMVNVWPRRFTNTRFTIWLEFDPVNISGKYPGNWWRGPAETFAPAFYRRSIPGTASMAICPAWLPAWHWSTFRAALCCKAQPLISYLLY